MHLLWSRCHRIEANFWNPWFYSLHNTGIFKNNYLWSLTAVPYLSLHNVAFESPRSYTSVICNSV